MKSIVANRPNLAGILTRYEGSSPTPAPRRTLSITCPNLSQMKSEHSAVNRPDPATYMQLAIRGLGGVGVAYAKNFLATVEN